MTIAVEQVRLRDRIAGHFTHAPEGLFGRRAMALGASLGDFVDRLGLRRVFEAQPRFGRIHPPNGAYGCALFRVHIPLQLVAHEPHLAGHRVIADVQSAIAHDTAAQSRAQRHTQQVAELLGAAGVSEQDVHVWQQPRRRFAVSEQVAVVVDESGEPELVLEHGAKRHIAVTRQIPWTHDDAMEVIRRSGEGETDGHRRRGQLRAYSAEPFHNRVERPLQIVRVRRQREACHHRAVPLDGGEDEVGAARVQCHYAAGIVRIIPHSRRRE